MLIVRHENGEDKAYEVDGDSVKGHRDSTGSFIDGSIERISGDRIRGHRDATGKEIRLREVKTRR